MRRETKKVLGRAIKDERQTIREACDTIAEVLEDHWENSGLDRDDAEDSVRMALSESWTDWAQTKDAEPRADETEAEYAERLETADSEDDRRLESLVKEETAATIEAFENLRPSIWRQALDRTIARFFKKHSEPTQTSEP